jgi:hypothetical protein
MDLDEPVRLFVLGVVADDYESFDKIQDEVREFGARAGLKVESKRSVVA